MSDPILEVFRAIEAKERKDAATIKAISDEIGHNGGPPIEEPFGIKAAWIRFANAVELARLSILHVRIQRKKAALKALTSERRTIMMTCIRRMRRAAGKN